MNEISLLVYERERNDGLLEYCLPVADREVTSSRHNVAIQ